VRLIFKLIFIQCYARISPSHLTLSVKLSDLSRGLLVATCQASWRKSIAQPVEINKNILDQNILYLFSCEKNISRNLKYVNM